MSCDYRKSFSLSVPEKQKTLFCLNLCVKFRAFPRISCHPYFNSAPHQNIFVVVGFPRLCVCRVFVILPTPLDFVWPFLPPSWDITLNQQMDDYCRYLVDELHVLYNTHSWMMMMIWWHALYMIQNVARAAPHTDTHTHYREHTFLSFLLITLFFFYNENYIIIYIFFLCSVGCVCCSCVCVFFFFFLLICILNI